MTPEVGSVTVPTRDVLFATWAMRANGAANRAKQQNNALFTMNSYYPDNGCTVDVCEQSGIGVCAGSEFIE
jgi:hypothetical protein